MNTDREINYGEIAYNAYGTLCGWKSVRGEPLPPFTGQSEDLQRAWDAAAIAVIERFEMTLVPVIEGCQPEERK